MVVLKNLNQQLALFKAKVHRVLKNAFPDEYCQEFLKHNRKVWANWNREDPQGTILLYYSSGMPSVWISQSYFVNILAKKHNAAIVSFSSTRKSFPGSLFYWARDQIYRSFNIRKFIVTTLDRSQALRKKEILEGILGSIKTKKDVYDIRVDGIWMGVDIYETYLRAFNKPTVDLKDPKLFETIERAVEILIFWQDYLKENNVKAVIATHDAYIYENILCKLSYQKNIPVYLPNIKSICLAKKPYTIYDPLFRDYPKKFRKLSVAEQVQGLEIARRQLERRFKGEVGVDMPYSTKSAFQSSENNTAVLRQSDKIKVLVCNHCFYDNPQAYGEMFFVDFYEWLHFLGKISEQTDYDWYIKMHPDPLPGTEEIIQEIIAQYPKITMIPAATSHIQLIKEGINFVLTAYGSVGHELAALGVQVINASYNPHYAYDFNWHPKDVMEYENLLKSLPRLKKDINRESVLEFYFMHYYYTGDDSLFLKSYRQYIEEMKKSGYPDTSIFKYFLETWSEEKHQDICAKFSKYIESGKTYYLSKGAEY
ncbi:MAG: hypothetical protein WC676_00395 [Candidatus Omnitrophota bacterium]